MSSPRAVVPLPSGGERRLPTSVQEGTRVSSSGKCEPASCPLSVTGLGTRPGLRETTPRAPAAMRPDDSIDLTITPDLPGPRRPRRLGDHCGPRLTSVRLRWTSPELRGDLDHHSLAARRSRPVENRVGTPGPRVLPGVRLTVVVRTQPRQAVHRRSSGQGPGGDRAAIDPPVKPPSGPGA